MKLFCNLPFERISIDDNGNVWPACCPDWVEFPFGNIFKDSWKEIWSGKAVTKFRDSCYNGTLRYCDWDWCPYIGDCLSGVFSNHVTPLVENIQSRYIKKPFKLNHINLNYDETCNLKCPTCRHNFFHAKGKELTKIQHLHKYVEEYILPEVESIALTGVGDPFQSQVFRKFLFEFNSQKYPNIKRIHFHTNGQLLTDKLYQKMKGIHDLDLSIDISIDAACEETYLKVRPPGNWKRLLKNLEFIKCLPNLKLFGISMVVQQDNYKEMLDFIKLGESFPLYTEGTFVEFKRPRQWGHLSDEQYEKIEVINNEEFKDLMSLVELKKVMGGPLSVRHNLQEFV